MKRYVMLVTRETRLTIAALAEGWPGLLLFVLVMLVTFMMGDK